MLQEILFSFDKLDYFLYFFYFVIIFIILNNFKIINTNNIIALVFTIFIMYMLIRKKIFYDYSNLEDINKDLIAVNIDKYKYLAHDISIVNQIVKLSSFVQINRVKFNTFVKHIDNFFYLYSISFNKNQNPTPIYDIAKEESKKALNNLVSFYIDIPIYQNLYRDRNFSRNKIIIDKTSIDESLDVFKNLLSKYLNEMEVNINSEWLKGDININSKPIYPDQPDPSVLGDKMYDNHFDIY